MTFRKLLSNWLYERRRRSVSAACVQECNTRTRIHRTRQHTPLVSVSLSDSVLSRAGCCSAAGVSYTIATVCRPPEGISDTLLPLSTCHYLLNSNSMARPRYTVIEKYTLKFTSMYNYYRKARYYWRLIISYIPFILVELYRLFCTDTIMYQTQK